jgi:hypothetical protein
LKAVTSPEYLEKVRHTLHADQSLAPKGCFVDKNGKIHSEWYDREVSQRNKEDVAENLDIDYLTSGNPVFDTEICNLRKMQSKPPMKTGELMWKIAPVFSSEGQCINWDQLSVEFVDNSNGVVSVWEEPISGWNHGYCISADVAEGLEQGDYDSAGVLKRFDCEKPTKVCTIHSKQKTFEYAETLAKLGVWYGKAVIAPERNNTMGGAVIEQLFRVYRNIYFKEIFTKGYPTRTDKLGWDTTSGTKGQIIGNLSKMISTEAFIDSDEGFWNETLTFVNNDGTLEAQGKSKGQKCYDDRVMMTAILLWVNGQIPLPNPIRIKKKNEGWRKRFDVNKKSLVRFTV